MSAPNAFDDLARRKLAGREHPFDEAAWEALGPALDAQRGRKRRRFILWFALLLGVGTAAWWILPGHTPTTASDHDTVPPAPAIGPSTPSTSSTATVHAEAPGTAPPASVPPAPPPVHQAPESPAPRARGGDRPTTRTATATPQPTTAGNIHAEVQAPTYHPTTNTALEPAQALDQIATPAADVTPAPDGSRTPAPDPIAHNAPATVDSLGPSHVATEPMVGTGSPDTSDTVVVAMRADSTDYAIAMDTVQMRDTSEIECSLPVRRLELSVWGGPFMTRTRYSGDHTADWASTVSGSPSFAFGAEMMRRGRHFGFGLGLHHVTYAEQLEAQTLQDEHRAWVTDYHLDPVDTTLLIVNGTVWVNGQQYHSTYLLDTTVYVLTGTMREEVSTNMRRNGLARRNRTSYLEIPLLFEAHTRRGPWSFALRGGPTLGILQGRRGVLPTTTGYTDLKDEAFHELVPGYTLQGHVRYHFAQVWSIGVGPAIRGQLMNSTQREGLQRRSNAAGAVISVGLRLP